MDSSEKGRTHSDSPTCASAGEGSKGSGEDCDMVRGVSGAFAERCAGDGTAVSRGVSRSTRGLPVRRDWDNESELHCPSD